MTDLTQQAPCSECGMACEAGEYHPYAACLMFKGRHNGATVRANLSALRTPDAGGRDACAWSPHDDDNMPGTWESSCGELWTFTEGGPVENNAKFCHCCGKPIQIAAIAQREGS